MDQVQEWAQWIENLNRQDLVELLATIDEELRRRQHTGAAELTRLASAVLRRGVDADEGDRG